MEDFLKHLSPYKISRQVITEACVDLNPEIRNTSYFWFSFRYV